MNAYDVLIRPVLSEKSTNLRESAGRYIFKVKLEASKGDVTQAVEKLFGVKPLHVRTLVTRGKVRRRGAKVSMTSKTKKAYITLPEGAKIPLFEDQ